MAKQVVHPKIRGFICTNAHPVGCAKNIETQANYVRQAVPSRQTGLNALIIGASTGYGLASRVALATSYGANTIGVFFEKPPVGKKTGTAGYYNSFAFHKHADRQGVKALSINGDAFSDKIKFETIDSIKKELGQVDLIVYSLASPRRIHPRTGEDYRSVLKPIGKPYSDKTIDLVKEEVVNISVETATKKEISDTIAVMGGEDLTFWVDYLLEHDCLKPGAQVVAYSYIGPEITHQIYTSGTIGQAKDDLQQHVDNIDKKLSQEIGGNAFVSVNKAVITQASAAIPVIPLYISILYKIMDSKGINENPIAQITRLFTEHLFSENGPELDDQRRIRLDDRELSIEVTDQVKQVWSQITTENLHHLADYNRYKTGFRNLFGFDVENVTYDQEVETDLFLP